MKAGDPLGGDGLPPLRKPSLASLQAALGHQFRDVSLLERALTHPSAAEEAGQPRRESYERMEFLGDAIFNLAVAEAIWEARPECDEGVLSKLRAFWVSRHVLADLGRKLGLGEALRLGAGEAKSGGALRERTLAAAAEAVIAAVFLDAGWEIARERVRAWLAPEIKARGDSVLAQDAKTALQEARQALGLDLPVYRTEPTTNGFASEVLVGGSVAGAGRGASRRAAEQAAAREAMMKLRVKS